MHGKSGVAAQLETVALAGLSIIRDPGHARVVESRDDREGVDGGVMPHVGLSELFMVAVLVALLSVVVAFYVIRALVRSLRK